MALKRRRPTYRPGRMSMGANVPPELHIKILSRLPVKSLHRFKCVCKFWDSLIQTPNLINLHLNHQTPHNNCLIRWSKSHSWFYITDLSEDSHSLHFSELRTREGKKARFSGSCNGVVCISDHDDVVLCNPLLESNPKVYLPVPADVIPYHFAHTAVNKLYGFGYDSKGGDYKVVRIVHGINYDEAKVLSLKNYQWKSVKHIPNCLYSSDSSCGVLVNEALHYLISKPIPRCMYIARFDLQTDTFSLLDFPAYDDNLRQHVEFHLRELGGCLSLMVNYHTTEDARRMRSHHNSILNRSDLWVMKEYGNSESWVKVFSISISELRSIGCYICLRPVVCSKDGRRVLIEIDYYELCWYDLVSKNFKGVTSHDLPRQLFDSGSFVGSLVSFHHMLRETN